MNIINALLSIAEELRLLRVAVENTMPVAPPADDDQQNTYQDAMRKAYDEGRSLYWQPKGGSELWTAHRSMAPHQFDFEANNYYSTRPR